VRHLGRIQSRHPGPWIGGDRRGDIEHRCGRSHPGGRVRISDG
jgi:hypothetical protein